jgi:hypothetical protein
LAMIFATAGIALGAGQIVQGNATGSPKMTTAELVPTAITPVSAGAEKASPTRPAEKPIIVANPEPASTPIAPPVITAALTDPVAPKPVPAPLPEPIVDACAVTFDVLAEPNAMIGIMFNAPCAPNTRLVLRHAGLAVTAKTSITGSVFMSLPALDAKGEVTATLKGQSAVTDSVAIPDLASLRRFGVQWQNDDAFQLHAFENGAVFGAPGHVSAAATQIPKPGESPAGGYLVLLGDTTVNLPLVAEVYTFPATGVPEIVVEAAITAKTCGRELLGETLTSTGGAVATMDVTLATPDCTAIGDILVLNNLVSDPTMVAAN